VTTKPTSDFDDSTATAAAPTSGRPLAVVLRLSGARAQPIQLRMTSGRCVVGSGPSCDWIIADKTVSRTHAEIELVPEGVSVRDLGSRNGTFYLGQRVQSILLGVGARIRLGQEATITIEADPVSLEGTAPYEGEEYHGIVGCSLPMRRLFAAMQRLEGSLVTVLIEGESGVGKECVARGLHDASKVASGAFVALNCGAIPRDLVASELFGHRRGAFTGAVEARRGAFEAAHHGTLFLDEIGELPVEVQPMLLRALESGDIRPVGEDHSKQVKVRLIAATNRDLQRRVAEGLFREDLYYRIAVVRLAIPPLRERPEDVEPLAARFAAREGLRSLPREVLDVLRTRPLPGNARELRNAVQAYAALGVLPDAGHPGPALRRLVLQQAVDLDRPFLEQRDEILDEFTTCYLEALLAKEGGNQSTAATRAGLDRTYLGRLLAKYRMRGTGEKG
jgi:two-component system response regulator GlrR